MPKMGRCGEYQDIAASITQGIVMPKMSKELHRNLSLEAQELAKARADEIMLQARVSGTNEGKDSRASFLERLSRLAGQTTFREGGGGGSPYSARMMTTENAMVLALSFARRDKRDIGPEIVYSIGTGIAHQHHRVVCWLECKLLRDTGYEGRRLKLGHTLATHCYEMVAFGRAYTRIPRESRRPKSWDNLRNVGVGWLWGAAESTIERAEWLLRSPGDIIKHPHAEKPLHEKP